MIFFLMGKVSMSYKAAEALKAADQRPYTFLARHKANDWGIVDAESKIENDMAVICGYGLTSIYETALGDGIVVHTTSDRRKTQILLEVEYRSAHRGMVPIRRAYE